MLITDTNFNPDLLSIGKKPLESEIDFEIESDELETTSNPLNIHRHAADESLITKKGKFARTSSSSR